MPPRSTPIYLPDSYWWSHGTEGATLYLRYGAEAFVTAGEVRILADGPLPEVRGPCASVEQGMRYVERFIQARTNYGLTPEQSERFRANKRWRERWKVRRPSPKDGEVIRKPSVIRWAELLAPGPEDDEFRVP